ncbi:MAG: 3'-5' exonuclease [Balneolaceae bacterium]|nr:3'-5' exonuclease [Balneolaceae bacterium]
MVLLVAVIAYIAGKFRYDEAGTPFQLFEIHPDHWQLVHIDVETTGLIPGYHEMIDIGIVLTDVKGNIGDSLFLRIQPDHPGRLSEGARQVNAFDVDRWKELGALQAGAAVDSIIEFHRRRTGEKRLMLVAHNSYFDAAFLDHFFRDADRSWRTLYHYYVLDISSMMWSLGFRNLTGDSLRALYKIPDEPQIPELHTGITGAMKNARTYQAIYQYRKEHFR